MKKHTSKHPFAARKISSTHILMQNTHANVVKDANCTKKDDEA
jgi:hypothetical protein